MRDQRMDAARGLALVMMVLHHLIYDLRYILLLDVFAWQNAWWFDLILRPIFLIMFLFVSGYVTRYSKQAVKRAAKMTGAAVILSLISLVLNHFFHTGVIYWNMLHTLAVGLWLHVLLKNEKQRYIMLFALIFLSQLILQLPKQPLRLDHMDYLPLLPWLVYFFLGVIAGQKMKDQPIPEPSDHWLAKSLATVGRHGLLVYALHQPVILGILWLLRHGGVL